MFGSFLKGSGKTRTGFNKQSFSCSKSAKLIPVSADILTDFEQFLSCGLQLDQLRNHQSSSLEEFQVLEGLHPLSSMFLTCIEVLRQYHRSKRTWLGSCPLDRGTNSEPKPRKNINIVQKYPKTYSFIHFCFFKFSEVNSE